MGDAAALLREGSFESAAIAYSALAERAPNPGVKAEAAFGAGVAKFKAGDRDGSIRSLQEALTAAPAGSGIARRGAYLLAVRLDDAAADGNTSSASAAAAALVPYLSDDADALTPYILAEYARALAGSGDSAGAAAAWDSLLERTGVSSSLRTEILRARADATRQSGDTVATAHWLAQLVTITGAPADRYELAGLAKAAGDLDTFAAQLHAIVANSPGSLQALAALGDLKANSYSVDAGQEGLVDYRHGLYADAITVLTAAVEEPGQTPAGLAFCNFYLAAANEDSGHLDVAVSYYDRAAGIGADSPYTHRAKYWAARVTETAGDAAAASARYVDLVASGPAGEFTSEAAFRAGYTLYTAGDAAGAVARWTELGVSNDARLLYWKGRAYDKLGDAVAAKQAYEAAYAAGPLDFFGLQAGTILGRIQPIDVAYKARLLPSSIDWNAISAWLATVSPGVLPGSPPTAAADLEAAGLHDRAEEVLFDAAAGAGPWRLLELMREARDAGLTSVAAQLAVRLRQAANVPLQDVPQALLQVAYPVDFPSALETQSHENGLDPLFLAAVVRQESFWDAGAGSHAGALGLTQVIPETGAAIAHELNVTNFRPDDLFRPALSLEFGAHYLGGQIKRYGSAQVALSAYNAGPGNAARWTAAAGANASPADYAETVDFDETQHYVIYIFEHYAAYLKAYTGG